MNPKATINQPATTNRPLPEGWRWVRLGEVCELFGDSFNPQRFPEETFAHYSIPAFDFDQQPRIEKGSAILSNKILFPNGSILFSKLNPRIPRIWHIDDNHSFRRICSTEFLPLLPNENALYPKYLAMVLQEPDFINRLQGLVAAATKSRERLKPEIVLDAHIPLPPLPEQKHIAAVLRKQLDAVKRLRRALEEQLEAINKLPAAMLRKAFNGEL